MADVKWTKAQAAAIEDRGGALLVSAAAGSGKTAVLAERAVRLITDPAAPASADRLLIVTFTNAAAAELRARIGERLARESRQNPDSARLRRQRMLLQRAPICTIDAFCLDLLRRHFSALDIPPDFSPADAGSLQALSDAALGETLEQAVQDADFCAFADLYGRGRSDAAAGDAVLQFYRFLQALPDPDRVLERFLAPWQQADSFPASPWARLLCGRVQQLAEESARLFGAARLLCEQDCADACLQAEMTKKTAAARAAAADRARGKYDEPLTRLEEGAEACRTVQAAADGGWQALYEALAPWRGDAPAPLPGLKGMHMRLTGGEHARIKALADQAADNFAALLSLVPCGEAEAEADRAAAAPLLAALCRAVRDYGARYYAKKCERKLLEFSDFEQLALRLLRSPEGARTPLCEAVCAGYDAVMVDEYQDTNALQDALYRCLARPDGSNLFLVGDLKQSIYRFRQADPTVFLEKQLTWPPLPGGAARPRREQTAPAGGLPDAAGTADAVRLQAAAGVGGSGSAAESAVLPAGAAQLALDANFRSAGAVVEAINDLFGFLMSPALGGIAYGPGQALVCGVNSACRGAVEAHILRGAQSSTDDADFVACRIAELVRQGTPVREGGGTRPLRYEDCCILLATHGKNGENFAVYAKALALRGIPVYADAAEDLLSAPQLRPLIALLRVIDNPAQNVPLAAAMRSALFGFTDDDLLRLRAAQKKRSLYGALRAAAETKDGDGFHARTRTFYERLTALRALSRSMPVDELLEEILASTGYLAAVGAGENGVRRRDEVRRFSAWAAGAGAAGLSALIRAIDATEAAGGLVDAAPGRGRPGCVSLMTIHRSKGLQFPAVFLADTSHKFNLGDVRSPVLLHRTLGMGLALRGAGGWYPTLPRLALREQYKRETLSEEMRLLYVALTRAQDLLVMTAALDKPERQIEKLLPLLQANARAGFLQSAGKFSDWLLAALLCHRAGGVLREAAGTQDPPALAAGGGALVVTLGDAAQYRPEEQTAQRAAAPEGEADPAVCAALAESFAWKYPAQDETRIPAKVSVTGVIHRAENTALERPGFLSAGGMTGAEMGTALHAFLQHADFAALAAALPQGAGALREAVHAETHRQTALRLTAPETAAQLDEAQILTFLSGAAFARIRAAERVLREYDFITGLPASAVLAAQNGEPAQEAAEAGLTEKAGAAPEATVLVQGIADLILVFPDHLELLDYKTDRHKSEAELLAAYRPQLALYARAIDRRFAPLRVTRRCIYSFALGRLIEA